MTVVTRFAPSPTGYLHIGGGRTALYSWLYARHHGGKFLLRIEDTDRARSTDDAVRAILDGLKWLGLDWDGEPVFQFARMARHAEVAHELLKQGKAYYCYCSPAELDEMRQKAQAEGRQPRYDGRWRDRDPKDAPKDIKPVIRIKAPLTGATTVDDGVAGSVTVENTQMDDMILLRSDGTPVYMLSVVVDDHDMGVTHVIRGDDHFTNTFRQRMIYDAMGWTPPHFSHLPLIHGPDGQKLSKRHGAVSVDLYRDMGYLPEAMRNYLLRLGWSHGDAEIIPTEQAIEWFNLEHIGKSPSRFDFAKLNSLNGHYIRHSDDDRLIGQIMPFGEKALGHKPDELGLSRLKAFMPELKQRPETLVQLAENSLFLLRHRPLVFNAEAAKALDPDAKKTLTELRQTLSSLPAFKSADIEGAIKEFSKQKDLKMGKVAMPFRAAITGTTNTPSVFHVAELFGRDETLARMDEVLSA